MNIYPDTDNSGSVMDQGGPDLEEDPVEGSSGSDSD